MRTSAVLIATFIAFAPAAHAQQIGAQGTSERQEEVGTATNPTMPSITPQPAGPTATGAFPYSIPFNVPAFKGIEPHLELQYQSGSGNGEAGVGWHLASSSVDMRTEGNGVASSPPERVPLLDGNFLRPCATLPAGKQVPGCTFVSDDKSEEPYFSEQDSGLRIAFDRDGWPGDPLNPNEGWVVTGQDGVRRDYRALNVLLFSEPFSYLLTTVTDPHGNQVHYHYTPVTDAYRYLAGITYNGIRITLFWEKRPDVQLFARGSLPLAHMRYRLRTILIEACTLPAAYETVRAYALTYTLSGSSGESLLKSVQEVGSDVVVDRTTGAVLNLATATRRAPFLFEYASESDYPPRTGPDPSVSVPNGRVMPPSSFPAAPPLGAGSDFIDMGVNSSDELHPGLIFQGAQVDPPRAGAVPRPWTYGEHVEHLKGDFNGDGIEDHVIASVLSNPPNINLRCYLGHTGGYTEFPCLASGGTITTGASAFSAMVLAADMTGAGRTDLVVIGTKMLLLSYDDITHNFAQLEINFPSGTSARWHDYQTGCGRSPTLLGDINGDGLADTLVASFNAGKYELAVGLSDGEKRTYRAVTQSTKWFASPLDHVLLADVNGDGRKDVVIIGSDKAAEPPPPPAAPGSPLNVPVCFRPYTTTGAPLPEADPNKESAAPPNGARLRICVGLADFDSGSGAAPFNKLQCTDDPMVTWNLYPGGGAPPPPSQTTGQWLAADVNGDGREDIISIFANAGAGALSSHIAVWISEPDGTFKKIDKDITFAGASSYFSPWTTLDVDGDHRTDLVRFVSGFGLQAILMHGVPGSYDVTFDFVGSMGVVPSFPFVDVVKTCFSGWPQPAGTSKTCRDDGLRSVDVAADGKGNYRLVAWGFDGPGEPKSFGGAACNDRNISTTACDHYTVAWRAAALDLPAPNSEVERWLSLDIDGDGYDDRVMVTSRGASDLQIHTRMRKRAGGWDSIDGALAGTANYSPQMVRVGDFDGDGADDLAFIRVDPAVSPGTFILLVRFDAASRKWVAMAGEQFFSLPTVPDATAWFAADQDGDGRDDVIYAHSVPNLSPFGTDRIEWRTYLSDGTGKMSEFGGSFAGIGFRLKRLAYPFHKADVDGDGAADLVSVFDVLDPADFVDGQKLLVLRSDRHGRFGASMARAVGGRVMAHNPALWSVVDANGDGTSDLAYVSARDRTGLAAHLQDLWTDVLYSTGLKLFPAYGDEFLVTSEPLGAYRFIDANGDGKSDLVQYSFVQETPPRAPADLAVTWFPMPLPRIYPRGTPLIGTIPGSVNFPVYGGLISTDVDRDTWTELEEIRVEGANVLLTSLFQKAAYNYLSKVRNPLGGVTRVTYRPFAEQDGRPSGDCALPPFAGHVVTAAANDARDFGAGKIPVGTNRQFSYHCARWSGAKREFHGFRTMVQDENQLLSDGTTTTFPNREAAKVTTTYDLTDACGARIGRVLTENPARSAQAESGTGFRAIAAGEAAPFDCRPTSLTTRKIEAGATLELKSVVKYTRDPLGQIEWTEEDGDTSSAGDERTTHTVRTIDADPVTHVSKGYVVTVAREELFEGTKSQAELDPDKHRLRATYACYDTPVTFDVARPDATKLTNCSSSASLTAPHGLVTARLQCIDVTSGKCPGMLSSDFTLGADVAGSRVNYLAVTTLAYDGTGNVTESIDPRGSKTTFTYDDPFPRSLFLSSVTDDAGHQSLLTWDWGKGLLTEDREPQRNVREVYDYDNLGRLKRRRKVVPGPAGDEDHLVTRFEYQLPDPPAPTLQSIKRIDEDGTVDGHWERKRLDGFGRIVRTEIEGSADPDTAAAVIALQDAVYSDDSARPQFLTDVYASTGAPKAETFVYDYLGRPIEQRRPGHPKHGAVKIATEYSLESGTPILAVAKVTDEALHVRKIANDPFGRLMRIDEPGKMGFVSARFSYDAAGDLLTSRGPAGDPTTYAYDSLGRILQTVDVDRGDTRFAYDLSGHLVRTTDANKVVITMTYDLLGRLSTKTDSKSGRTVTLSYDSKDVSHGAGNAGWGMLTSIRDSAAASCAGGGAGLDPIAMSFAYDLVGHTVQTDKCWAGVTKSMKASFDTFGRMATLTYPDSTPEVVQYKYDDGDRIQRVTNTAGTIYVDRIGYDAAGRLRAIDFGNGVTERNTYDASWRLLATAAIREKGAGSDTYNAAYSYTADRLIESLTVDGALYPKYALSFSYDAQHRLTAKSGFKDESFQYDDLGNLSPASGATFTFPAPAPGVKQLHAIQSATLPAGMYTFSHDPAGNLDKIIEPSGDRTFTWDGDNRLSLVTRAGSPNTTFAYDALGERMEKTVAGGDTRLYFAPMIEWLQSGAGDRLIKYYFAGDRLIARRDGEGLMTPLRFYHQDHVGSTVAITDESGKTIADTEYRYLAYGSLAETKKTADANDILFTGTRHDFETAASASGEELLYLGSRYYIPAFSCFISADSILPHKTVMGLNRYAYASGNPISRVDRNGAADENVVMVEAPQYAGQITTVGQDQMIAVRVGSELQWADYSVIIEPRQQESSAGGSPSDVSPLPPAAAVETSYGNPAPAMLRRLPDVFVLFGVETKLAKFVPAKQRNAMSPLARSAGHRATTEALLAIGWKPFYGVYVGVITGGGFTMPRMPKGLLAVPTSPLTPSALHEEILSVTDIIEGIRTWSLEKALEHRQSSTFWAVETEIPHVAGFGVLEQGAFAYKPIGAKSIFEFIIGGGFSFSDDNK